MADIEKVIPKRTILGGYRQHYAGGVAIFPPIPKQIIDMAGTHPEKFDIVYKKKPKAEVEEKTEIEPDKKFTMKPKRKTKKRVSLKHPKAGSR